MNCRVARYHNIFGPEGTWQGGKEKAPAAMCRKVALAGHDGTIEIWGDGEQTRSFLFIDDCIEGTLNVFNGEFTDVFNVGSEEQVSINQMIEIIEEIANFKVNKKYDLTKPKGVRGRSSDNQFINDKLQWTPNIKLRSGLEKTYSWIYNQIKSGTESLQSA